MLGYFRKKICRQELSKIVRSRLTDRWTSGHTDNMQVHEWTYNLVTLITDNFHRRERPQNWIPSIWWNGPPTASVRPRCGLPRGHEAGPERVQHVDYGHNDRSWSWELGRINSAKGHKRPRRRRRNTYGSQNNHGWARHQQFGLCRPASYFGYFFTFFNLFRKNPG